MFAAPVPTVPIHTASVVEVSCVMDTLRHLGHRGQASGRSLGKQQSNAVQPCFIFFCVCSTDCVGCGKAHREVLDCRTLFMYFTAVAPAYNSISD